LEQFAARWEGLEDPHTGKCRSTSLPLVSDDRSVDGALRWPRRGRYGAVREGRGTRPRPLLVQRFVNERRDLAQLRLGPFRVIGSRRQGPGDRPVDDALMNTELRGHTRNCADTKLMLPTDLLEQIYLGFPFHKSPRSDRGPAVLNATESRSRRMAG